jgi:hypothetical protein
VQPGRTETMPVFLTLPREDFEEGIKTVMVRVTDGGKYAASFPYRLAGPMRDADDEREHRGSRDKP